LNESVAFLFNKFDNIAKPVGYFYGENKMPTNYGGSSARVKAAENIMQADPEDVPEMEEGMEDMPEMEDVSEMMAGIEEPPVEPPAGVVDIPRLVAVAGDFGKSEEEAMEMVPIIEAYMAAPEVPEAPEPPAPAAEELEDLSIEDVS
jgi:hypothetical protein